MGCVPVPSLTATLHTQPPAMYDGGVLRYAKSTAIFNIRVFYILSCNNTSLTDYFKSSPKCNTNHCRSFTQEKYSIEIFPRLTYLRQSQFTCQQAVGVPLGTWCGLQCILSQQSLQTEASVLYCPAIIALTTSAWVWEKGRKA